MDLKPTCFNDLVALLALGRPGTLDMAKSFIRRKNHQEKVDYIDETLEGILKVHMELFYIKNKLWLY